MFRLAPRFFKHSIKLPISILTTPTPSIIKRTVVTSEDVASGKLQNMKQILDKITNHKNFMSDSTELFLVSRGPDPFVQELAKKVDLTPMFTEYLQKLVDDADKLGSSFMVKIPYMAKEGFDSNYFPFFFGMAFIQVITGNIGLLGYSFFCGMGLLFDLGALTLHSRRYTLRVQRNMSKRMYLGANNIILYMKENDMHVDSALEAHVVTKIIEQQGVNVKAE